MTRVLFFFAAVCGVLYAVSGFSAMAFKRKHAKFYGQRRDSLRRRTNEDNIKKIISHNVKYAEREKTFILGEKQFPEMTNSQDRKSKESLTMINPYIPAESPVKKALPVTVDWRTKGYVTPVKFEGTICNSSWAFAATGAIEGQHFKKTGKLVSLSEKNLMDCSGGFYNMGCVCGSADNSFKYVIANNGIDTETSYPYSPYTTNCKFNSSNVGATISSYKTITSGSESELQEAVATVGPVAAEIDAGHYSFYQYKTGVYDEPSCFSNLLNYGVLIVGYGVEKGKDYWLVKTSKGTTWGDKGYIKMSRNKKNQCGIATAASYPIA